MSSTYPGTKDTFTNPSASDQLDSVTVPHATQHANLNDAMVAVQSTLGVNPQGGSATVTARIGALETGPHRLSDGSVSAPAYSFANDTNAGVYRLGSGDIGIAVAGAQVADFQAAQTSFTGTVIFGGNTSVTNSDLQISGSVALAPTSATLGVLTASNTKTLSTGGGSNTIVVFDLNTNYASSQTEGTYAGMWLRPRFTSTGSVTNYYGILVNPSYSGTGAIGTSVVGVDVLMSAISGGGSPLTYGMRIRATIPGTTAWALGIDATQSSYTKGRWAIGNNTAPTWLAHIQGGNSAASAIGIDVSTTGPTVPGSNAAITTSFYKGATNYYFLITMNDGGTTRYKYLQMNGTGTTWATGTSLPT